MHFWEKRICKNVFLSKHQVSASESGFTRNAEAVQDTGKKSERSKQGWTRICWRRSSPPPPSPPHQKRNSGRSLFLSLYPSCFLYFSMIFLLFPIYPPQKLQATKPENSWLCQTFCCWCPYVEKNSKNYDLPPLRTSFLNMNITYYMKMGKTSWA